MNLFLDTTSLDFVLILFNNSFEVIDYTHLKGYKKKVDLIPQLTQQLLTQNNLSFKDINNYYTNIGPGFFTGVRSSLVYFRTLALISKAKIYTISTWDILKIQNKYLNYAYINAQGKKVYQFDLKAPENQDIEQKVTVIDFINQPLTNVNYSLFIKNFWAYSNSFMEINLMEIKPHYIKKPQIGAKQ
ncbi:tRNA (adenosine(37)-N6)-threonylcarbamoyltransferase complex dimerization subunit type 1 TsaB [Mycoplasma nasistruthionis]|uniref:tRNA (Adenosine(37)-N6)-threonylcarbamoyltransferase complex dimerization subunit type 1 TsaB n=1 Tax=Mycoplasma nasistruthionis TaxID=353852 RepID=A0A4Y6I7X5_9MOLU|nr:tRNA (adenosine(37)-N6)-threonylcarbamoyltransferase complex dimerization subunit type 1 TsaB [Mycoplasma nasistruthionis]QDF65008.1 tRNA (adenosine(37)-N6)-threonylcarbamoyltransferase complex dimerization subunit type 1 TsaB [Mycoplasma nasistruthionis]